MRIGARIKWHKIASTHTHTHTIVSCFSSGERQRAQKSKLEKIVSKNCGKNNAQGYNTVMKQLDIQ